MLRSLVGSEMCIRDRNKLQAGSSSQYYDLELKQMLGHAYFEKKEFAKACLLYTSDAADDLLCVDLGGRRIIKKKNTTHHFVQLALTTPPITLTHDNITSY